jgi:hypothetical protein
MTLSSTIPSAQPPTMGSQLFPEQLQHLACQRFTVHSFEDVLTGCWMLDAGYWMLVVRVGHRFHLVYRLFQRSLLCCVQPAIDSGDFFHPPAPLCVLQIQDIGARPVKVIGNVGYLLVQAIEGIA